MTEIVNVADIPDPSDPEGRTFRQVNAEKTHAIPIGAFVELEGGCRAWVVSHGRDCDKTPLYWLCMDREDTEQRHPNMANFSWTGGYSEESLTVLSDPPKRED